MNILATLLAPLSFSAREERKENLSVYEANKRQTVMLLRGELEHQYELLCSPDPEVRGKALDEIERIEPMLRAAS